MTLALVNEQATLSLGKSLGEALVAESRPLTVVYLHGDLGAGKTTLVRAVLRGLGFDGSVKSPTYTLVEEYDVANHKIYHFDLYRLADPEELEFMGMRDFLNPSLENKHHILCFVEWPEKGFGLLPDADIEINLSIVGKSRQCDINIASTFALDISSLEREVGNV